MTAVIDTNVLVSAALVPGSTPANAVALALARGAVLFSPDTIAEARDVLGRPKLDRFRPPEERTAFLVALYARGIEVPVIERITACRDPKDDKFLEVAVNGRATHLVTGDTDLLELHPFRGVAVLTPADFVALFDPPAGP